MNSVILIGRLARDPELSYTPNTQSAVCRFTIAVDRPRRQGEDQGADFIRITVWGRQAETCDRYLSKGRQVAVMGRIQTGSYTNRDGAKVYTTDVVVENAEFAESKSAQESRSGSYQPQYQQGYQQQNSYRQQGDYQQQGLNMNFREQQQQQELSPQQAQQLLQAIQEKEKQTQEKVDAEKAQALKSRQKEKNW